jgi:predicted alpha/beta-hydrolase family hydrolase
MVKYRTLPIIGHQDEPLPHTFLEQEVKTDHLALLLPGVGYTVHMPLLYYPMLELVGRGADVLRVETMYVRQSGFGKLSPADRARWVFADAIAACSVALAQRAYTRITLVGKSLGTMTMGYLLTSEARLAHANAIWLTPLLWNDVLRSQIQQTSPNSLFVVGTADPHYNPALLSEVETATDGQSVVIEEGNHSLEIQGDVLGSIQAIDTVMRAVKAFLDTC